MKRRRVASEYVLEWFEVSWGRIEGVDVGQVVLVSPTRAVKWG